MASGSAINLIFCEEVPPKTPRPPSTLDLASEGAPKGPAGLLKANENQKTH